MGALEVTVTAVHLVFSTNCCGKSIPAVTLNLTPTPVPHPIHRGLQLAVNGFRCVTALGPTEALFRALRTTGVVSAFHSVDFFILDEPGVPAIETLTHAANAQDIVCREVARDEVPAEAWTMADWVADADALRRYFSQGSRLFVATHDGRWIASQWLNQHSADLSYIRRPKVLLPAGFAYLHGAMTSPASRGRGIGTTLRHFIARTAFTEGSKWCISAALLDNAAAQHWHRKSLRESYWGRISYVRWRRRDRWLKFLTATGKSYPELFDAWVEDPARNDSAKSKIST
jgi:GNAT superfamily N-acetyltransferase